jgi:hypothetical protein
MSQKRAKQIRKALRRIIEAKTASGAMAELEMASRDWDTLSVKQAEYARALVVAALNYRAGVVDGRGEKTV